MCQSEGRKGRRPVKTCQRKGTDKARKVVTSEKEGNTPYLSGEGIIESVGNPAEEVNLNTLVHASHTIPYSSSSPPLLVHISKPAAKISLVSENYGIEANNDGSIETVQ